MRITCPSCTSHFELPAELLGPKGRALKCATCGHAWYQTAQVGELDLAAVMGEDYAQNAQNDLGQAAGVRVTAADLQAGAQQGVPRDRASAGARAQAAPIGAPGGPGPGPQPPPVPPGAVSMMRRV